MDDLLFLTPKKKSRVAFSVPSLIIPKLKEIAKLNKTSMGGIIRTVVLRFINSEEGLPDLKNSYGVKTTRVGLIISGDVRDQVNAIAKKHQVSANSLVYRLVCNYIENYG